MADYVPVFKAGHDVTFVTTAAVTGGQLCALSGSGTVAPTSAATEAWFGVALTDAASGGRVALSSSGIQEVTASGAITAGASVMAAAAGAVTVLSGTNYAQVVGVAVTTAANGAKVRVKFAR